MSANMLKFKRAGAVLIAAVMICGLTACGRTGSEKESETGRITEESRSQNASQDTEQGNKQNTESNDTNDTQDAKQGNTQDASIPNAEDFAFSSTDWKTLEFALDGEVYTFPMTWSDVEAAGYQIEDEYRHEVLGSYQYTTSLFAESETGERFYVRFKNFAEGERELQDCYVYGFGFEQSAYTDVNPEVMLCNGVTFGMTVEEVKEIMGEPNYYWENNDPNSDYKIINYYVTDSSLGSEIELNFRNGVLNKITIENKD